MLRGKQMRHWLFVASLFVVVAVFAFLGIEVYAQSPTADFAAASGLPTADIRLIIARIIRVVVGLLGVVLVALVVYGGFMYMLARGDAEKAKKAIGIIRTAVIGLAIVLASFAIATFVINAILRAAGLGGGGAADDTSAYVEPLSSALGLGIIQDHYPPRGAVDVPRNTKIIVTFKRPMFIDSLIADGTHDPDSRTGQLNADNIFLYQTALGETAALASSDVNVSYTEDQTIFVFDPVPLLGSAVEDVNYSMLLDDDLLFVQPDGVTTAAAFPSGEGYLWTFTTSTVVDITPPRVDSFIPNAGGTYARNIVTQITFNEPIDPTSSTGSFDPDNSNFFDNIQIYDDAAGAQVEGTVSISNGYRTIEFISFDQCGENACGGDIYCLPADADIIALAKAATLGAEPPSAVFTSTGYDGVVDVAGNSLDGGGQYGTLADSVADGPPPTPLNFTDNLAGDNFWTDFSTTGEINTDPPIITSLLPTRNAANVGAAQDVEISFSEQMRMSTLNNSNIILSPAPSHPMWFVVEGEDFLNISDETVTRAVVDHSLFREYEDGDPVQNYYPLITNDVETAFQICFFPAYGPPAVQCGTSVLTDSTQSCCNGVPTSGNCSLPTVP